ncbi:MAG: hypothetical protein KGS45_09350 [Planctomycetes bacterium]|nr:hypothetical protein [Planctomycetota bacterium]
MKNVFAILALTALAGAAQADIVIDAVETGRFTIGQPGGGIAAVPNSIYSNVDTFSGQAYAIGGATNISGNTITRLFADDIICAAHTAGPITSFHFNVANLNTSVVSARARVRFYADNGSNAPGTYITGYTFNPISFTANSVTTYVATGISIVDQGTNKFWAGITFDNNTGATGATEAQLNNLGMGLFNPVDIGSSADTAFGTTAAGSFLVNSPAGANFNFNGTPNANFGWAFIPTPSSAAMLSLGGLMAARRRRV